MEFNQVNKCVFETRLNSCIGISSITDEGITLFNDTFNTRVKSMNCDLDRMIVAFTTEQDISYKADELSTQTKHTIRWMKADYKVHWKVNAVTLRQNTTKEALKGIRADEWIVFNDTVVVDYIEKI